MTGNVILIAVELILKEFIDIATNYNAGQASGLDHINNYLLKNYDILCKKPFKPNEIVLILNLYFTYEILVHYIES